MGSALGSLGQVEAGQGIRGCDRAQGHLMGEDTARAGTAPHSLCSWHRQSWLLFRLPGEQLGCHWPKWDLPGLRGPSRARNHHPLTLPRQREQPQSSWCQGAPQGHRAGGAAMLHRPRETTSGPTSAQQAGKSSPGSATCKVPAQTSVSSQGKKSTNPQSSGSKDTAELQERESWLQAARCLQSSDRFQQGSGHWCFLCVTSTSPSRGTSSPEGLCGSQTARGISAGIPEQTSPQR